MQKICITGGIACGKSEVGKMIESYGFPVLDTDAVAHRVLMSDMVLVRLLVHSFGGQILDKKTGMIDRRELGKLAFRNKKMLDYLGGLIHPKVLCYTKEWVNTIELFYPEQPMVFCLIPLVFEVRDQDNWDVIVCISCDEEIQRNRMKMRGLNDADIDRRIASQMDIAIKRQHSRFTIENNGIIEDLGNKVDCMMKRLTSATEKRNG